MHAHVPLAICHRNVRGLHLPICGGFRADTKETIELQAHDLHAELSGLLATELSD